MLVMVLGTKKRRSVIGGAFGGFWDWGLCLVELGLLLGGLSLYSRVAGKYA